MTSLTEDQKKEMLEYRERHYTKATTYAPVNVEVVTEAINTEYKLKNKAVPSEGVVVVASPKAAMVYLTKREYLFEEANALRSELTPSGSRQVFCTDTDKALSPAEIQAKIDEVDLKALNKDIKVFHNYILSMPDVHWMSFYIFCEEKMGEVYGEEDSKRLRIHETLVNEISYWFPYEEFCLVVERPTDIMYSDDEDFLHNEHGPSVRWSDGYSWYHYRGVQIPKSWIEDKDNALTLDVCLKHPNLEQRNAACMLKGWAEVLKGTAYTVIDKDPDPEVGSLLEVDLPDLGREKFLFVRCGTQRFFALPVPPEMRTALEANSWTYGMDTDTFLKKEARS